MLRAGLDESLIWVIVAADFMSQDAVSDIILC